MDDILVLGGTGFLGRSLLARLIATGGGARRVTVPTRRLRHGRDLSTLPTVRLVEADVHDDATLARLVRGRGAVVNLVAILHGDEDAFDRVHVALPRRLAAAVAAASPSGADRTRLVHVSALGVAPDAPSRYLRSKAAGEAALRAGDPAATILRPSVMFGERDRLTNLFAGLQGVFPVLPLGGASARFQPVWVEDVATAIDAVLARPETAGQTFECAGPDTLTLAEIVELSGRIAGHPAVVLPIPAPLARLQAMLMELAPGDPLMSRDNLDSMKVPNVASGRLPGFEALGIQPSALATVGPGYLGRRGPRSRLDALRRAAGRR